MRGRNVCVAFSVLGALTGAPMQAQNARAGMSVAMTTDSAAWQSVLIHIVERLSSDLVRASTDTTRQPWDIHLPPAEPQRELLDLQLRRILRARPSTPSDSVYRTIDIGRLRITGDTATVDVGLNYTRRCPGTNKTTGYGWSETVFVTRLPQFRFWGAARSRSTMAGDRVSCPRG
jgi:hypothetical protein